MNILFVCKYNRFRSRIAESYFKKINKDSNIHVQSSGLFQGSYPLDNNEIRIAKKFGIILRGKPRAISTKLLKWQNLIVVVADDVPVSIFKSSKHKNKVIRWKITDEHFNNENNIKKIIKQIMKRVESFNEGLK